MAEPRDADLTAWLRRLTPDAGAADGARPGPASSERLRGTADALLGPGPVEWAVRVGADMARAIIAEVPELGGGAGPFETLRMGTEAVTLSVLIRLADPSVNLAVTEEALLGDRDFVHRRIGLDKVLRGIRIGHARLSRALLSACRELVPARRQAEIAAHVSELLFEFVDEFASRMAAEFAAEHERWASAGDAAREQALRKILDGAAGRGPSAGERERAQRLLGYRFDGDHVAVVARCASPAEAGLLQRTVRRYLGDLGAVATLLVPDGACGLRAWGSLARATESVPEIVDIGVRFAVGSVLPGIEGFRQSHDEARRTARILDVNPRYAGRVLAYPQLRFASLLARDPQAARVFVRDALGPLALDAEDAERLRETLRRYLRAERSLAAAAAQLHVARNTVTYRVKRAQELLGREVGDHLVEVLAALEAAHVLGSAVLTPPEGRTRSSAT